MRKYLVLADREKSLFLEALVLQIRIGLLLKLIPFKWIPRFFPNPRGLGRIAQDTGHNEPGTRKEKQETLILLKAAIQRASQVSPWKNKCLVSSLTARRMLNRRKIPSQLYLGMAKSQSGQMIAHAWLKAGDYEIIEKGRDFIELFLF